MKLKEWANTHEGLVVWGCFGLLLVTVWIVVQVIAYRGRVNEASLAETFIRTSDSAPPDRYFQQMVGVWEHLEDALSAGHPHYNDVRKLEFQEVAWPGYGKFGLSVSSESFGREGERGDLGVAGRRRSTKVISQIAWLCGRQIQNVDSIHVDFKASDEKITASFGAVLSPDQTFLRHWTSMEDPELINLVDQKIQVTDNASGKEWIRVPKNY